MSQQLNDEDLHGLSEPSLNLDDDDQDQDSGKNWYFRQTSTGMQQNYRFTDEELDAHKRKIKVEILKKMKAEAVHQFDDDDGKNWYYKQTSTGMQRVYRFTDEELDARKRKIKAGIIEEMKIDALLHQLNDDDDGDQYTGKNWQTSVGKKYGFSDEDLDARNRKIEAENMKKMQIELEKQLRPALHEFISTVFSSHPTLFGRPSSHSFSVADSNSASTIPIVGSSAAIHADGITRVLEDDGATSAPPKRARVDLDDASPSNSSS
ncbi:hypothetical protein ABFS83_11G124000 [Erythranthe nasuta]